MIKGDVAGHEFHGNQYSDGGGAAQLAAVADKASSNSAQGTENRSARGDALHSAKLAWAAYLAHGRAAKVANTTEAKNYHSTKTAEYKAAHAAHAANADSRYSVYRSEGSALSLIKAAMTKPLQAAPGFLLRKGDVDKG